MPTRKGACDKEKAKKAAFLTLPEYADSTCAAWGRDANRNASLFRLRRTCPVLFLRDPGME